MLVGIDSGGGSGSQSAGLTFNGHNGSASVKTAEEYHKDPESFKKILDFFAHLGWFKKKRDTYQFTDKGLFFAKRASAYGVTVSYIPTFLQLDELIFGNPLVLKTDSPNDTEKHVHREMNVWGSGGAHSTYFKVIDQVIIKIFNKPIDEQPKGILDMGCGTGILAIFAEMKGAKPIDAIDIDRWCYENSLENADRNNCEHISVYEGDSSLLKSDQYDVIIANINRNILLSDMEKYSDSLHKRGTLLLSGFYSEDIPTIDKEVSKYDWVLDKKIQRNNWVALKYIR